MYALILTLCSFAGCNSYIISTDDAWTTKAPCQEELYVESELFGKAFIFDQQNKLVRLNSQLAQSYLNRFNVREELGTLTNYDFTCEKIADSDIP